MLLSFGVWRFLHLHFPNKQPKPLFDAVSTSFLSNKCFEHTWRFLGCLKVPLSLSLLVTTCLNVVDMME